MFSDRFVRKSINQTFAETTTGKNVPTQSLIAKRRSAPNTLLRESKYNPPSKSSQTSSSLLRQQSLPPAFSSRNTKQISKKLVLVSHASPSSKFAAQRQQSIPCKGSPKPPLLEHGHTVHSVPPVITHTRAVTTKSSTKSTSSAANDKGRGSLPIVESRNRSCTSVYSFEKLESRTTTGKKKRTQHSKHRSFDAGLPSSLYDQSYKTTDSLHVVVPSSLSATARDEAHFLCYELDERSKHSQNLEAAMTSEEALCVGLSQSLDLKGVSDDEDTVTTELSDDFSYLDETYSADMMFEEELTDLDEDDGDDLSGSDGDEVEDEYEWVNQEPVTCVQRERDREKMRDNLATSPLSGICQGLVAEVEKRRERDFGTERLTVLSADQLQPAHYRHKSLLHPDSKEKHHSAMALPVKADDREISEKPVKQKVACATAPPLRPLQSQGLASLGTASSSGFDGAAVCSPHTPRGTDQPSPPLRPSLFPKHLPPTIHFPLPHENYTPFSKSKRALLKWKMSTITPNIVKSVVARAGFSKWTRGSAWIGYWGKHMREQSFKAIKEHQKVNHFPGTFQIGRKDRLWRNLSRMQIRVGRKDCDFVPQTFILPHDLHQLKKEWDEGPQKQKWILKPPAAARGIGVRLAHKWGQIPKKRPVVVQRYISDPYLINGSKFDLRVYVYVSSYDPLKIYVFKEGLARFATTKYSTAMKHLSNKFMHLTNYSINKHNSEFTPNTDETVCQGHKWGLLALWRYMQTHLGLDTDKIWDSIKDVIVKTIVCSEPYVSSCVKAFVRNSHSVHELFGFDIMLDRQLKPWLLEVNISPSLHSNSQLDVNIKGRLVRDLFNIAGFTFPSREQVNGEVPSSRRTLSTEERIKHSQFAQRNLPQAERRKILDNLTPSDVLIIMKSEDEFSRCGHFERVFPTPNYEHYKRFFETERYNNILLCEWAAKYQKCPRKGHLLLSRQATSE